MSGHSKLHESYFKFPNFVIVIVNVNVNVNLESQSGVPTKMGSCRWLSCYVYVSREDGELRFSVRIFDWESKIIVWEV